MLNQKSPNEVKHKSDHTIESLFSAAKVAQIRLKKFIEDNEDEDRLGRLLELNGMITSVLIS